MIYTQVIQWQHMTTQTETFLFVFTNLFLGTVNQVYLAPIKFGVFATF